VTPEEDSKFLTDLFKQYKYHRLDFSTFGGQSDGAILVERLQGEKTKPKLLQKFTLN